MNRKKKFYKYFALALGIYCLYPLSFIQTYRLAGDEDPQIKQWVEENIETIIEEEAQDFGLENVERPTIKYSYPKEDRFQVVQKERGRYKHEEYTIVLASSLATTPQTNVRNIIKSIVTLGKTIDIDDLVRHEVRHYLTQKLGEEQGDYTWMNLRRIKEKSQRIGARIILEGIAENYTKSEAPDFDHSNWPNEVEDFGGYEVYRGGHFLMKPIIDTYGSRGIVYVMQNQPTRDELLNLEGYQKRVLEELLEK